MVHFPGDILRGVRFLMGRKEPFAFCEDQRAGRMSISLPNFGYGIDYGIPFWFFRVALGESGRFARISKQSTFGQLVIDFEFSDRPFTFISDDMGGAVIRARGQPQDLHVLREALSGNRRFIDRTDEVRQKLREGM